MGTTILILIGVILAFAVLLFLISPDGEREEGAKTGAALGCSIIASLAPTVIIIIIIVIIVKSCS